MSKINYTDNELPYIAYSLCKEILETANEFVSDVPDEIFKEGPKYFEKITSALQTNNIDSLSETKSDVFDPYKYPSDEAELEDFFSPKMMTFFESMEDVHEMPHFEKVTLVMGLAYGVQELKVYEEKYLTGKLKVSYQEFMNIVDKNIHYLALGLLNIKTIKPAMGQLSDKVAKKKGAKKGGIAKSLKTKELKEHVLEKARENYANENASQTARSLYQELDKSWLIDEKGTPLSKSLINSMRGISPIP